MLRLLNLTIIVFLHYSGFHIHMYGTHKFRFSFNLFEWYIMKPFVDADDFPYLFKATVMPATLCSPARHFQSTMISVVHL